MIYKFKNNDWYIRDVKIEKTLVMCYDIMPSQVILGVNIANNWFVIFKDKWTGKIKFIFIKL